MHHSSSTPYLFSFGETHPQLESLDEEFHHLIVLRFNGRTVKLSLLIPKGHNVDVEETFLLNKHLVDTLLCLETSFVAITPSVKRVHEKNG